MSVINLFWNEMPSRTDVAKEVCSVALLDILSNQSLQLILIIKICIIWLSHIFLKVISF